MGSSRSALPLPLGRLAGVGAVIFLANAALLVLQLVASRLLAPFVGSDLYTWTGIIGVFLAGIALGNGFGGKIADRFPTPRTLAVLLAMGSLAAAWMVLFPMILNSSKFYQTIPLGPRIPLLAVGLCLPAGLVLSLLTPVAIKLGLPDVSQAGRVAGMIFALSTLGCLLGNYATGFYLIPEFTINTIVLISAGLLMLLAIGTAIITVVSSTRLSMSQMQAQVQVVGLATKPDVSLGSDHFKDIRTAYAIVFLASFCGMTLELAGIRLIAQYLGVSLFTWTGVIGVMLAGTAAGNFTGGILADRVGRRQGVGRLLSLLAAIVIGSYSAGLVNIALVPVGFELRLNRLVGGLDGNQVRWISVIVGLLIGASCYLGFSQICSDDLEPRMVLGSTLVIAAGTTVLLLLTLMALTWTRSLDDDGLVEQIIKWTFALLFLPMFLLGMISPQVIRLAVPDMAHVGQVAGRVYAWSTTGAIVGTFATGYVLISLLGVQATIITVALILCLTAPILVFPVWKTNLMLYVMSIVLGGITGGYVVNGSRGQDEEVVAIRETNYYTIKVTQDIREDRISGYRYRTGILNLTLDHLLHSSVDPDDPLFIYYKHEFIQMEFLRLARVHSEKPQVLVIGGGGYTFPRYAKEVMPEVGMDVVEIDPGVTQVAYNKLGLKRDYGIRDFNIDGRQFVAERAAKNSYDLIVQDAVNDLSVPSHLLTREYNDEVKSDLKPDGVYLLTVIDSIEYGKLWRAAMATLKKSFRHVVLISPSNSPAADGDPEMIDTWAKTRQVYVIYASDHPIEMSELIRQVNLAHTAEVPIQIANAAVTGMAMALPMNHFTRIVPEELLKPFLEREPGVILTDQYSPVDNLMAEVFRRRNQQ